MNRIAVIISAWLIGPALGTAAAADLPAPIIAPVPVAAPWSWTGFYIGAQVGAALEISNFSDPFGSAPFGDNVRSPAFIGGGQIGANYQIGNFVFGVESDVSWGISRGDNTCFGVRPGQFYASNCSAAPDPFGTITGRLGYAFDRSLVYAKGGGAWEQNIVDMAVNNNPGEHVIGSGSKYGAFGWTVGFGAEYAITPAWSLNFEYDYLGFGDHNVNTPYVVGNSLPTHPFGPIASLSDNIQLVKLGLNYRFGEVPIVDMAWPAWASSSSDWSALGAKSRAVRGTTADWETEFGERYMYSWGRAQWDYGAPYNSATLTSRLTWTNMMTNSAEFYGRADTPVNVFVSGFIGTGSTYRGDQNDEDFRYVDPANNLIKPYQNTYSSNAGHISYGVADLGYDVWRHPDFRFGPFAGYTAFNEYIFKYGCSQIVNPTSDCSTPAPTSRPSQLAGLEDILWHGLRVGVSGQFALTDRITFAADAAYLPYVGVNWLDDHITRDEQYQMLGHGVGVQTEAMLTYKITDRLNIGLGARYWAMWTNVGTIETIPGNLLPIMNRNVMELAGAFVQLGYSFETGSSVPVALTNPEWTPFVKPSISNPGVKWTGFYGGVEGGGAWRKSEQIGEIAVSAPPRPTNPATPWFEASGGLVGFTAGYNSQFDRILVYGVEGDVSLAGIRGSAQQIAPFRVTDTAATKEKWFSTGRARLGFTPSNGWLVYGTGGIALADVEAMIEPSTFVPESHLRAGWTVGSGIEAAISAHWSAKIEYLHVGLEDHAYFVPTPNISTLSNRAGGVPISTDIVRVGVNYRFD